MIRDPVRAEPPRRILLATDLSSRTDRALDRAVQLSGQWRAELHVVHAVDATPPAVPFGVNPHEYLRGRSDPCADADAALRQTLLRERVRAHVQVAYGTASRTILDVVEREGCDLVILGEGRDRLVGPLEGTLDHVVRASQVSVLAVRDRSYGPYRKLLVGTDFTGESQHALSTSAQWFPDADIAFVHAYSMPYSGLLPRESTEWADQQLARLRAHLDEVALPSGQRASIRTYVGAGPPAVVLPRHARDLDADLTVIGAHPRGMLFDTVVGSSRQIIDAISGDLLVVRASRGDGP